MKNKALTQGDDYGFTKAVTYGILDAIDNGVLRNTGIFINMPIAEWAVSFIKDRPQACFGIDFNIVAGPSVSNPKDIPHLVDENGNFIKSGTTMAKEEFKTEEGRRALFPFEEVYKEIRAQYNKYVRLVGEKPGYLHAHSLMHENYLDAIRKVGEEEGLPFSMDLWEKVGLVSFMDLMKDKNIDMSNSSLNKKVFDPIAQINKNPLKMVLDNADYFLDKELFAIMGHPGYVDAELFEWTTLSLERMRDHQMMTSPELLKWIEENDIELITYQDLYKFM